MNKKFLQGLISFFKAYAESQMSTATNTSQSGQVQLTDAIRAVYSKEIEFKALPLMRFLQFATEKTELGTTPGLTIKMMTYNNLKLGGKLKEGVRMTTQALSSSMKEITVSEHGNAIAVTELLLQSSFDNVMASATQLLSRDYALVVDCELRDTALGGTNVVYARNKSEEVVADRKSITADCTFKVSTIKDAVEILATNNAPKYGGINYICFLHPHQSRGLRDDKNWVNASNYGDPTLVFKGEIGKIDDTRFIETTLMCNGACTEDDPAFKQALKKGDSSTGGALQCNVYQSVLFGDNYYAIAWGLPVELRDNGTIDFNREHGLAWYSIWGTGILHNENGVVIETA